MGERAKVLGLEIGGKVQLAISLPGALCMKGDENQVENSTKDLATKMYEFYRKPTGSRLAITSRPGRDIEIFLPHGC